MRQFTFRIKEQLKKGLRRYRVEERNTGQVFELYNLQSGPSGIEPYQTPELFVEQDQLILYGADLEYWPYPQLFVGNGKILVATRNTIYEVPEDERSNYWAPISVYDGDNPTTEVSIPGGAAPWQMVDMQDTWILTNGRCIIFYLNDKGMFGNSQKALLLNRIPFQAACFHKGRVLLGGFNYNKFWNSTWRSFWNTWITKQTNTGISKYVDKPEGNIQMPVGENWLWWSSVGGGDILPLFLPSLVNSGVAGFHSSSKPYWLENLRKNDSGFSPLPYVGTLRILKPLGDFVIAYTDTGVMALRPVTDPEPTYAQLDLPALRGTGLATAGAVGGNAEVHVFVDRSGFLWQITSDLKVERLGYQEFFAPMLGSDIVVTHSTDPRGFSDIGRFWIGNKTVQYHLDSFGLSETQQKVSSATYYDGKSLVLGTLLDDGHDFGLFGIGPFDGEQFGIKSLESVYVKATQTYYGQPLNLQVAIDYRFKQTDEWKSTDWKPVNDEGWAFFPASGEQFRLKLKINNYNRINLNELAINIAFPDNRYNRGITIGSSNS